MRFAVFTSLLALLSIPALARAQGAESSADALRRLGRGAGELRADAGQSYRRLMAIRNQLLGEDGARVTITQESALSPLYRTLSVSYALDGQPILRRVAGEGRLEEPLSVLDGVLGPGEHVLTVILEYQGQNVVGYLPGYRFEVRSTYSFTVTDVGHVRLRVRPYTLGPLVPFTRRLDIEFERMVDDER